MIQAPCKDCSERQLACHDRCKKYITWHNTMIEDREKLREIRRNGSTMIKHYGKLGY